MPERPIMIISGTNRPNAFALKVARVVEGHYRQLNVACEVFSLADLPPEVFQPTAYATKPPAMVQIQNRVLNAVGLHVVSPEYNGGFPGILKYFIDMLKFPESFEHKPVAFIGEAAGIWGGIRPIEQLQQIFGYRNAHIFPERVFIPAVNAKFDEKGSLIDPVIDERIAHQVAGFARFATHMQSVPRA